MESLTSYKKLHVIAADTSTIINLNATGWAADIVRAIGAKFVIVDTVQAELEDGRRSGRRDADRLNALLADGILELVELDSEAAVHFEGLVIGPAVTTLDDGEAATIAYAITNDATAAIDERKAMGICAQRFPQLTICSTIDILAAPEVERKLGKEVLSAAVYRALIHGRMRVLPHRVDWVIALIGPEKATECTSLPKVARRMRNP